MACYGVHACRGGRRIAPEDLFVKPPEPGPNEFSTLSFLEPNPPSEHPVTAKK